MTQRKQTSLRLQPGCVPIAHLSSSHLDAQLKHILNLPNNKMRENEKNEMADEN